MQQTTSEGIKSIIDDMNLNKDSGARLLNNIQKLLHEHERTREQVFGKTYNL